MKKALLVVLALVLVAALSVGLTMAYLTSQAEVTNTFTVGKVDITLDEAKVNVYGVKDGDTRVAANTYKLIPGHNYVKDPTIRVAADSEVCYVFVKVENEIFNIEDDNNTIASQITSSTNGWTPLQGEDGVYYKENVDAGAVLPVFGTFTIADDANVTDYNGKTIKVTAYAVQKDGLTLQDAWAAVSTN